ncbi:MAG: DUF4276 family protein [Deltaproteobacteria bacterium]|nr:DUF4276 family protein [Deltaproteobacteria bacterium]
MRELTFTLLADGPGDAALIPILRWSLRQRMQLTTIQSEWADLRRLPNPPRDLPSRILQALKLYPCDVLFVHRDAENQNPDLRYREIEEAMERVTAEIGGRHYVCVVPVRMQEAWLLISQSAIRRAAGNPNGTKALALPDVSEIESIPSPKNRLLQLLKDASELTGRRLKKFRPTKHVHLIAANISDFSPLCQLPAFQRLEADILQLGNLA